MRVENQISGSEGERNDASATKRTGVTIIDGRFGDAIVDACEYATGFKWSVGPVFEITAKGEQLRSLYVLTTKTPTPDEWKRSSIAASAAARSAYRVAAQIGGAK